MKVDKPTTSRATQSQVSKPTSTATSRAPRPSEPSKPSPTRDSSRISAEARNAPAEAPASSVAENFMNAWMEAPEAAAEPSAVSPDRAALKAEDEAKALIQRVLEDLAKRDDGVTT